MKENEKIMHRRVAGVRKIFSLVLVDVGFFRMEFSVFSSIFKHDFHQSFILNDTEMHFTETHMRNIFKNEATISGSCLNTADIC